MARTFVAASSQYLSITGQTDPGPPITLAIWCRPTTAGNGTNRVLCTQSQAAAVDLRRLILNSSNTISANEFGSNGATSGTASTVGTLTTAVWTPVVGVFASSTSRSIYALGEAVNNASTCVPLSMTVETIGRREDNATQYFDGDLAEAAMWTVALTAGEAAMFAAGISPLLIRPEALVRYRPLLGAYSPEIDLIGHKDLTVTGATAATHPRVYVPDPGAFQKWTYVVPPIPPPVSLPLLTRMRPHMLVPPFGRAGPRLLPLPGSTVLPIPAVPSAPNTPSPTNAGTSSVTRLTWLAAGQARADVYLGTSASPPLVTPNFVGFAYVPTLLPSTLYYWQIVAKNDGGSTAGPIWSFTTPSATAILITIAGVLTTHVRADSLSIHDAINAAPNTASFVIDVAPTVGQAVQIGLGTLDASHLIFAGTVQDVGERYVGTNLATLWPVSLIDYTFTLNKRRPFGTWTNVSATTIAQTIVSQYAPGFTALHVQASLPTVSITFDGSADFMTCLGYLATAIAGFADVDYSQDVWLFRTRDASDAPDPLDASHPPLNDPSSIAFSTDLSQVRSKVLGKGHGETVPGDVAAGETILPIADASTFNATGGQAMAGTTSSGAQSQKLTYQSVQLGGGGSLVGSGAAPSVAPSLALVAGSGLGIGVYQYAYTDVTAAGESLPSPLGSVTTTPAVSTPSSAPTFTPPYTSGGGNLSNMAYEWAITWKDAAGGETLPGPRQAVSTPGANAIVYLLRNNTAPAGAVSWNLYRTIGDNLGGQLKLSAASIPVATTSYNDGLADGSLGANVPTSSTATTLQQVAVSAIAIGASPTTSRKVYRTAVNDSQLKLHTTIANNTATTIATDSIADGSLGANVPTNDLSGLTFAGGQINAGSTALVITSAGQFQAGGGWAYLSGGQAVRYTGIAIAPPNPTTFAAVGHISAGSTDTTAVTTGALDTTGATLLVLVLTNFNTTTEAISDSKGNTWIKAKEFNEGNVYGAIYYVAQPIVGAGHTFTASTAGSYPAIAVAAFSGVGQIDVTSGASGKQAGSITPTGNNALIIAGIGAWTAGGTVVPTAIDSGFTLYDSIAEDTPIHHNGLGLAYKIQTTAAAVNPLWTCTGTDNASVIAAFTIAAATTGGTRLTGIPPSGPGAITTTVLYGSTVTPAPALVGINSWNGLPLAMAKGSSVKIWVERTDLAAQLALGALELDANGQPTDGIHEFTITDERRGEASLIALCDADLALFSRPIVSATYYTRDSKTKSGKSVAINLAGWGLAGTFTIQDVTLTFDGPALSPRYQVKASSVAFTLADLLRRVVLTP